MARDTGIKRLQKESACIIELYRNCVNAVSKEGLMRLWKESRVNERGPGFWMVMVKLK